MKQTSHTNGKKASVIVLGCKVNQAEAAAMAKILGQLGYMVDQGADDPALIVVNTCCVTSKAEAKSRRMVSQVAAKFPKARLLVTGCLAEINPSSLQKAAKDARILCTEEKDRFYEHVENGSRGQATRKAAFCKDFGDLGTPGTIDRGRAFLKVQDGCSQYCSYCIVPRARGPERSLRPDVAQVQAADLEREGYAEIVLTGVHLGSYGRDLNPRTDLKNLLVSLLSRCLGVRIRLSSVEPQEISEDLIRLMGEHPRVCRHFHIPVQSGDDTILGRMRRPYNADFIRRLTDRIRNAVPEACIGMDIMVGFPGEDDRAFGATRNLVETSGAAYLHVFPFSPRPGTPAAMYRPRTPSEVAQKRVEELRDLSMILRRNFYRRFLGRAFEAVIESSNETGYLMGRTDHYVPVLIKSPEPGPLPHVMEVVLQDLDGDRVIGACLQDP